MKAIWYMLIKYQYGNACGCICPHCKSALSAKNGGDGEKMIHHFAHLSGADCVGAVESALHLMAKKMGCSVTIVSC